MPKYLLMICAALACAHLLAFGLVLPVRHTGGVLLTLFALGIFAIRLTPWAPGSEPPMPPAPR